MNFQELVRLRKRIGRRLKHEILWREHLWRPVGLPRYTPNTPVVASATFEKNVDAGEWYSPVLVSSQSIGRLSTSAGCLRQVVEILQKLEPDPYTRYLLPYFDAGLSRFGDHWHYADITTALLASSQMIQPQNYLEIGVRRGRSMAMVAATCPQCNIVGFDMWVEGYGRVDNPGPEFVEQELSKVGYKGNVQFINGDSHQTVPQYLRYHPDE